MNYQQILQMVFISFRDIEINKIFLFPSSSPFFCIRPAEQDAFWDFLIFEIANIGDAIGCTVNY